MPRIHTPGRLESFDRIKISRDPNKNWNNDHLQFARLLAEMVANISFTHEQITRLADSMDLANDDVHDLLDRAQNAWDDVKMRI